MIHAQTARRDLRSGPPEQTHDPSLLVGQWVLLRQEHSPVHGVLVRAARLRGDTNGGGPWEWAVRTPFGLRAGTGRLEAEPLSSEHRTQVRRARWELSARLAECSEARDPEAMKARYDLELLELQIALHP